MNIYDEVLEYLKNGSDDLYSYQVLGIKKALERAKKEHELLGLYRYLNENTNDYDLHPDEVDETHNKIYELEEELK